jgi:hypothetical protein
MFITQSEGIMVSVCDNVPAYFIFTVAVVYIALEEIKITVCGAHYPPWLSW